MAEERKQSAVERFFWPLAALVVVVLVVVAVVVVKAVSNSTRDEVAELNNNYVEKIDIRSSSVGGSSRELIVVDGTPRYDCSARDGKLTCSRDPQPTPER